MLTYDYIIFKKYLNICLILIIVNNKYIRWTSYKIIIFNTMIIWWNSSSICKELYLELNLFCYLNFILQIWDIQIDTEKTYLKIELYLKYSKQTYLNNFMSSHKCFIANGKNI